MIVAIAWILAAVAVSACIAVWELSLRLRRLEAKVQVLCETSLALAMFSGRVAATLNLPVVTFSKLQKEPFP